MTINVHEVVSLHAYEEPNGSYGTDASASFGSFMAIPFRRDKGLKIDLDRELHSPEHARQHMDAYDRKVLGRKRAKATTLGLNLSTFTTRAASAVTAAQGPLGLFLKVFMGGESLNTGTTVTGSGSTASTIDCTDSSGIAVGSAIGLVNAAGLLEVREVLSNAANTITVKLAFSFTPSAAAVVYASATYYLGGTLGSQTTALQIAGRYINALDRNLMLGGYLESMKIELNRGKLNGIDFDVNFANWLESAAAAGDFSNDGALTALSYTNSVPLVEVDSALFQQTVGTATFNATTSRVKASVIEFTPQIKYTTQDVPGGVNNIEQPLRDSNVPVMTGAFVCPFEDLTWRNARENDTVKAFTYQLGSVATRGAILISAPRVQIEKVMRVEQDRIACQRVEWCTDNDRATSPNTSDLALSAFRIHLL